MTSEGMKVFGVIVSLRHPLVIRLESGSGGLVGTGHPTSGQRR